MDSETLHIISIAFFVSGMIFLALTIVFAIKFELLSIIKSNMKIRREKIFSDGDEYFAYVENRKKNSYTYSSENKQSEITESSSDDNSGTVLQKKEEEPQQSATVISNSGEQSNVTVIVNSKPELKKNENDFIIVKEIMVINGSPDEVTRRHLSR
ncbi:MAG: hypothetical protein K2K91_01480 [Ruminococcus sp.]|nr:hypothetical protein [Ruminococcus sp.]